MEEEATLFSSQAEAKSFFVDRIVSQASAEGQPLSDNERWMLRFSESDPDFIVDLHRVAQLEAEISDSDYEDKIVGLLERSYQRDASAGTNAQALYREASATLHQGDHYLLIMIDRALGYVPKRARSKWVRGLAGVISFVVLVVPGSVAILISVGMAAMLLTGQVQSSGEMSRGGVASLVLGGIGYYLIHLWRGSAEPDASLLAAERQDLSGREPRRHYERTCTVSAHHERDSAGRGL